MSKALCSFLLAVGLLATQGVSQAQVQRSFVNLSFEQPALATNCFAIAPVADVPGWRTNHPNGATVTDCPAAYTPSAASAPVIEIWRNSFNGVLAAPGVGSQWAELNAYSNSRIFQNVCIQTGERVDWEFFHRGRESSTIDDVAEFNVDSAANTVVTARTQNDGGTGYTAADCTSSEGGITAALCNAPALSGTWRRYSGSFVWNGASGLRTVGFQSISTSSGNISRGNFIDGVQFSLTPYVQFISATYAVTEGTASVNLQVRVLGVVPTGGISIAPALGGTATGAGTDYSIANLSIPAGDYSVGQTFNWPVTITNDTLIENNETLTVAIASTPQYTVASTTTCGVTPIGTTTLTIQDNDVDLRTTKTVSTATPTSGVPFTYTVTFTNNTAQPTLAPLTAHNVTAVVADAVPAGLTFSSWTCAASGGASCPAAAGSGAISGNAVLPAGAGGGVGGSVTYTIQAVASAAVACGATRTNTGTITVPAGVQEGLSAQAGFTTPAPGGVANNSASVDVVVNCSADLSITKANNLPGTVDLANDTVTRGQSTTYRIVVTNNGPTAVTGAVVTDTATGLTCTTLTCASSSGSSCPAAPTVAQLTGAGITLLALPVSGTLTLNLTCTVN